MICRFQPLIFQGVAPGVEPFPPTNAAVAIDSEALQTRLGERESCVVGAEGSEASKLGPPERVGW